MQAAVRCSPSTGTAFSRCLCGEKNSSCRVVVVENPLDCGFWSKHLGYLAAAPRKPTTENMSNAKSQILFATAWK